ncbi:methyltransferase family protein [Asanoa ferruginea]|uniref:Methyltransferase family protein n=1 Tax=Asanoa ferruginea TaxID=53367 RepID=A0A3D9ZQ53_9ACTN|nr:methyltransferase domain-containing protein [Asanoa ferruginea]REF99307.1 methyltransferase family protein [Asanoa ferruginea]
MTYVMGRTAAEYARLREQARTWADATGTLLDTVGLAPGARCLDVGCGPGETMRLMAQRVGPTGRVVGVDVDADLGRAAVDQLTAAGHRQCEFVEGDIERADPVPDGGFDLVFGRLILLHVADPVAVLRRMWGWTAPGGALVVQDYDMRGVDCDPPLPVVDDWRRVFLGTYTAAGRDVGLGHRLPRLFAEATGAFPDGTVVNGRIDRLASTGGMLAATYRSITPVGIKLGTVTEAEAETFQAGIAEAMTTHPDHQALWPLLVGAHRRR